MSAKREYVTLTETQASMVLSSCAGILGTTDNWLWGCPEWYEAIGRRKVNALRKADGLGLFRPDNLAACIRVVPRWRKR